MPTEALKLLELLGGLQIRVRRFNSDLGLQYLSAFRGAFFFRAFLAFPRLAGR